MCNKLHIGFIFNFIQASLNNKISSLLFDAVENAEDCL